MTLENKPSQPGEYAGVDPATLFMMAQMVTGLIMAVTALTNPTFGQLDAMYKSKGLL